MAGAELAALDLARRLEFAQVEALVEQVLRPQPARGLVVETGVGAFRIPAAQHHDLAARSHVSAVGPFAGQRPRRIDEHVPHQLRRRQPARSERLAVERAGERLEAALELHVVVDLHHHVGIGDRLAQVAHRLEGDHPRLRFGDLPILGDQGIDAGEGPGHEHRADQAQGAPEHDLADGTHGDKPVARRSEDGEALYGGPRWEFSAPRGGGLPTFR